MATRSSIDEPFSNPMNLNDFSLGSNVNTSGATEWTPYISRDWPTYGSKIYFGRAEVWEDFDIYEATWVPEPSTAMLAMLGLLGILATAHRRHSRL